MGVVWNSSRTTRIRQSRSFFFSKVHPIQRIVLHTTRFEVEIEMRGDNVSVFRMEVTRGKEDATANYRMIIN